MGKSHKGQHWVPKSYLQAWTDPATPPGQTPYVHVFSKDGAHSQRRAPSNIFTETDLYIIKSPDGRRDLRFERGLSQLEGAFARTRQEFLSQRRGVPSVPHAKLLIFVAAMHARTPFMRDHHSKFWKEVLSLGEQMEQQMRDWSPDEKRRARGLGPSPSSKSMTVDQVRRIAENTMQEILAPLITAEAPLLSHLRGLVLCTMTEPGFITSDNPVVWFDPDWHKNPPMFRSPSFSSPKLEITLPLSPGQALMLTHGEPGLEYRDVPDFIVAELNRRTRFHCGNEFVVRRKVTDPYWFDPGLEPDDSWHKVHKHDVSSTEPAVPE